jgi:hypothetical protein
MFCYSISQYFLFLFAANDTIRWLEWSNWSNCSESCGNGVHVRTRLCSTTAIKDSSNPCSSLGGDSFEIESCQDPECNRMNRKCFLFHIFFIFLH